MTSQPQEFAESAGKALLMRWTNLESSRSPHNDLRISTKVGGGDLLDCWTKRVLDLAKSKGKVGFRSGVKLGRLQPSRTHGS
jgi:hypothetical protein